MSQPDLLDQDPVFLLKGSMLATTILELSHNDLARLDRQLEEKVAQAPAFFENIPLIIAVDKLPEAEGQIDLAALMQLCGKHGCAPWPCAPGARKTSPPPAPSTYRCCRRPGRGKN